MRIRTVRQAGVRWFFRTFFFCVEGNAKRSTKGPSAIPIPGIHYFDAEKASRLTFLTPR